jgi:hypothetical protein
MKWKNSRFSEVIVLWNTQVWFLRKNLLKRMKQIMELNEKNSIFNKLIINWLYFVLKAISPKYLLTKIKVGFFQLIRFNRNIWILYPFRFDYLKLKQRARIMFVGKEYISEEEVVKKLYTKVIMRKQIWASEINKLIMMAREIIFHCFKCRWEILKNGGIQIIKKDIKRPVELEKLL